jgi:hypothetical protein
VLKDRRRNPMACNSDSLVAESELVDEVVIDAEYLRGTGKCHVKWPRGTVFTPHEDGTGGVLEDRGSVSSRQVNRRNLH